MGVERKASLISIAIALVGIISVILLGVIH